MAVIPPKMQLRNAFLLPEGEAVLDLAVDSGLTFGSDEELDDRRPRSSTRRSRTWRRPPV